MKKIRLLGVPIARISRREMIRELLRLSTGDRGKTACYMNAHCLNMACTDAEYRSIVSKFDLVYAGGQAVVLASRMWNAPLPERVNVMDYFNPLVAELKDRKIAVYLLGADEVTIDRAARTLARNGVYVVGWHHGYFSPDEEAAVIAAINAVEPDLLIVGMGVPKQEKWIDRNRSALKVKLCWALGGFFEYAAGSRKAAPAWIVNSCLEWLYLGAQRPFRLVTRYLVGNILFIFRILYYRVSTIGVNIES